MLELELRASQLKDFIDNPSSYYYPAKPQTDAMKLGVERERLSYRLFADKTGKDFKRQVYAELVIPMEFKDHESDDHCDVVKVKLTGHCDIVTEDYVCDIKNSVRNDEALVKDYWYQLNAYALLNKKNEAYIFADANDSDGMDLDKTRMIPVKVDSMKFITDLTFAVNRWIMNENLVYSKDHDNPKLDELIKQIVSLEDEAKAKQEQADKLRKELTKEMFLHEGVLTYKNTGYSVTTYDKKDTHRKMQALSETWDGEYKLVTMIKKNK